MNIHSIALSVMQSIILPIIRLMLIWYMPLSFGISGGTSVAIHQLIADIKAGTIPIALARQRAQLFASGLSVQEPMLQELEAVAVQKGIPDITHPVSAQQAALEATVPLTAPHTSATFAEKVKTELAGVSKQAVSPVVSLIVPVTTTPYTQAEKQVSIAPTTIAAAPMLHPQLSKEKEKKIMDEIRALYEHRWSMLPDEVEDRLVHIIDALGSFDIPLEGIKQYDQLSQYIVEGYRYIGLVKNIQEEAFEIFTDLAATPETHMNRELLQEYHSFFDDFMSELTEKDTMGIPKNSALYTEFYKKTFDNLTNYQHTVEDLYDRLIAQEAVIIPHEHEEEITEMPSSVIIVDQELYEQLNGILTELYTKKQYTKKTPSELEGLINPLIYQREVFDEKEQRMLTEIVRFYKNLFEIDHSLTHIQNVLHDIHVEDIERDLKNGLTFQALAHEEEITEELQALEREIADIEKTSLFTESRYIKDRVGAIKADMGHKNSTIDMLMARTLDESEQVTESFIDHVQQNPIHGEPIAEIAHVLADVIEEKQILEKHPAIDKTGALGQKLDREEKRLEDLLEEREAALLKEQPFGKPVKPIRDEFEQRRRGTLKQFDLEKAEQKKKKKTEKKDPARTAFVTGVQELYSRYLMIKPIDLRRAYENLKKTLKGSVPKKVEKECHDIEQAIEIGEKLQNIAKQVKEVGDRYTKTVQPADRTMLESLKKNLAQINTKAYKPGDSYIGKVAQVLHETIDKALQVSGVTTRGVGVFSAQELTEQGKKLRKVESPMKSETSGEKPKTSSAGQSTLSGISSAEIQKGSSKLKSGTLSSMVDEIKNLHDIYQGLHIDELEKKLGEINLKITRLSLLQELPEASKQQLQEMNEYLRKKQEHIAGTAKKEIAVRPVSDIIFDLQNLHNNVRGAYDTAKKNKAIPAEDYSGYVGKFNSLNHELNKYSAQDIAAIINVDTLGELKDNIEGIFEQLDRWVQY